MNQNNDRKIKAQTLGSVMRHPKLSRTFADAIDAPIGSTKRKQAQTMLAVMNKVNSRSMPVNPMAGGLMTQGGATGGPGFIGPMPVETSTPAFSTPPTNKLLFSAAPSPKLPASTIGPVTNQNTSRSIFGKVADAAFASGPYAVPLIASAGAGVVGAAEWGVRNTGATLGLAREGLSKLVMDTPEGFQTKYTPFSETTGAKMASDMLSKSPWAQTEGNFQTPGQVHQSAQTTTQTPPGMISDWDRMKAEEEKKSQPQGQGSTGTSTGVSTTSSTKTGTTSGTSLGTGLSNSSSGISSVQDAVNKNMGPAAFAYNAMGDKELLKKLFPGVPEDQLPIGASLTQQVASLQGLVKKDLNIDVIENSLANKIKMGVNLENDLNSYIRGRDEMINNVDSMITDLESKMYTADALRDPATANTMKTYGNYLYTLKGRAAQRYVSFANESISQYNAELSGLNSLYESKMSEFETIYNQRAAITQETYNRTYSMLTDLYNNIEQAPTKAANAAILANNLYASSLAVTQAGIGAGGPGGMQSYTGDDYIKTYNFMEEKMIDPDTKEFRNNLSLDDYITQALSAGLPVSASVDAYANLLSSQIEKYKNDPAKLAPLISVAKESLSGPMLTQLAKEYPGYAPSNFVKSIYEKSGGALSSSVTSKISDWKSAVTSITTKPWFGKPKFVPKSEWISNNSASGIPAETLGTFYDNILKASAQGSQSGQPDPSSAVVVGMKDAANADTSAFSEYIKGFIF